MAQSMRRSNTLGTMDHKLQRDKSGTGYFGNVKNRLGSKLSASSSQTQELRKTPLEPEPGARCGTTEARAGGGHPRHAVASGPVHHIRNPKLRQYYLQGTWSECEPAPPEGARSETPPRDTVFSITSQSDVHRAPDYTAFTSSTPAVIHQGKKTSAAVPASSLAELKLSGAEPRPTLRSELRLPVPSPEAEYDKLLDVEAVPMPDGQLCLLTLPPECCQGEGPEAVPYLKLFCRYITDGKGVVSGILLVTSTKLFFDPCKAHPLVVEQGCEEYLLSASLDRLASITLFSDTTHLHFSQSQHRWKGRRSTLKTPPPRVRLDSLNTNTTQQEAGAGAGPSGPTPVPPSGEDGGSADVSEAEKHLEALSEGAGPDSAAPSWSGGPDSAAPSWSGGPDSAAPSWSGGPDSAAPSWSGGPDSAAPCWSGGPDSAAPCWSGGPSGKGKASELSGETEPKEEESAPGGRAASGPAGVMFVRLRTLETPTGPQQGASSTLPRGDAWLALSKESSEQLSAYLSRWRPKMSVLEGGEEDREGDVYEEEFVLIEDDEEEHNVAKSDRHSGEDWEMLCIENGGGQPALLIDRDPEGLADILEASCILEATHIRELCTELPPRTIGHAWQLTYSTACHGFSLKSLYRRLRASDSPVLIVIKDALHQVFGSFLSHPLRPSETFYGTGETFLFMLHPRFKCFRWTGENTFFIKGNLDSFAIGGGSGHFGLWLDETLYLGRSSPCYTFNNCCLSEVDDFHVIAMEVWTFS